MAGWSRHVLSPLMQCQGWFFLGWTALKIVLGCFTAWVPSTLQIVNRFLGGGGGGFRWFLSVTLDFNHCFI